MDKRETREELKGKLDGAAELKAALSQNQVEGLGLPGCSDFKQALLNTTTEAVFLIDSAGRILALNQAIAERLGGSIPELLGKVVYDYLPREVADRRKPILDDVFRTGKPACFEDERSGRVIGNSVYPVFDSHHRVSAIAIYASDITDRKKTDQALQEAYQEMDRCVQERTAEIKAANERLREEIAVREETERALRASEERFRAIFFNAPVGIGVTDSDGRLTSVNRSLCEILGHTNEELTGRCFEDIIFAQDPEPSQGGFRASVERKICPHEPSKRFVRKDGEKITLRIVTDLLFEQDSDKASAICVIEDITEPERVANALRESQRKLRERDEFFRAFMDNSPVVAFVKDEMGRYVYINKPWEKAFHRKVSEVLGKTTQDVWPLESALQLGESDETVLASNGPLEFFQFLTDPAGNDIHLWVCKFPLSDSEGNRYVGGVALDVTKQKHDEKSLRESEEKYRRLHETMTDAFVIADMAGCIQETNRAYQVMLGYSEEELRSLTYVDLTPEKWHAFEARIVEEQILAKGHSDVYEKEYRRKDGHVFPVEMRTFLVRDDVGNPSAMWATVRDITERKRTEATLRENHRRLEQSQRIAGIGTWDWDTNSGALYWSDEMYRIFGLEPGSVSPSYELAKELTHPDDTETWENAVSESLESKERFRLEYRALRHDGSIVWIHNEGEIIRDPNGHPMRILGTAQDITERKKAEEAVHQSEERFRVLYENLRDGMAEVDERGRIVRCNPKFLRMLGYTFDEVAKLTYQEITPSRWHAIESRIAQEQVDIRGYSDLYEKEYIHKNGSVFPIEIQTYLARDRDGKKIGYWAFVRDISERKKAQEELRVEKEFTDNALNSQRDTFFLFDHITGRAVRWNRAFSDVTGYTDEEIAGMQAPDSYYGSEDLKRAGIFIREVLEKGDGAIHLELICKDGHKVPYEYDVSVVKDAHGKTKYLISIGRDITERKKLEEAGRKSEQRYRNIFEATADGLIVFDKAGRVFDANPAACRMYGYTKEEFSKLYGHDIVHPDKRSLFEEALQSSMAKQNFSTESFDVKKDGTYFWVEVRGSYLEYDEGMYALGLITDISDRKRTQDELIHAKNEAESANRAKSEFLANMSHELRTPLNAIIGFSEILTDQLFGNLNEAQKRHVGHILQSGQHLLQLVGQVLDLSKIESGRLDLDLSQVNVCNMLESSLAMMRERIVRQNQEMDLKVNPEIENMTIRADELKLKQVMFNLLSNSTKFTPENGRIQVEAQRVDSELIVSVRDTGMGIDEADSSRIFKAFEQADSTFSRRHEGTGLGLALARKLVEMHGGRVWVESEGPGQGSTFTFAIPIEEQG